MDPLLQSAGENLLSSGVLGIAVVGLVYFVMMLRAELRDVRAAHRVELAEKDKLIIQLQESRLSEAKTISDLARSVQSTMEALLVTIRST